MRKTGTKTKDERFDYFRERDTIRKQYTVLMNKAGIAAAVERCQRRLEPDYFEDRHLPPLFTKARAEARKLQDAQKFLSMRGTAAAVFAVIAAMYGLSELERMRSRDVQRATAEVADLEATINEIVEQEVFSQLEEHTGERDEHTP